MIVALVMSASGVQCNWEGSGDAEGLGVGICGASTETDVRVFFGGAALLRFLGEAFLVGDIGSGRIDSSGSNICEGSMLSPVRAFRVRAAVRGVGGTSVVFRRGWRLGLR